MINGGLFYSYCEQENKTNKGGHFGHLNLKEAAWKEKSGKALQVVTQHPFAMQTVRDRDSEEEAHSCVSLRLFIDLSLCR